MSSQARPDTDRGARDASPDWDLPPAVAEPGKLLKGLFWNRPTHGPREITHKRDLLPMKAGRFHHYVLIEETYYRDDSGRLIGVLRHWPTGCTLPGASKKKGEYSIAVLATSRRRGVGMALLTAADQEWGLDFWCQTYTDAGRSLVIAYLNKRHALMIADKKSTLAMATPIVNAATS